MKLMDFMEFLLKTTNEESIKWNVSTDENGVDYEMRTTVGVDSVILFLSPETKLKVGKYLIPLSAHEEKIAQKIYKFVNDYERYFDLVVEKYKKSKR